MTTENRPGKLSEAIPMGPTVRQGNPQVHTNQNPLPIRKFSQIRKIGSTNIVVA